jgi:hypothetical protein
MKSFSVLTSSFLLVLVCFLFGGITKNKGFAITPETGFPDQPAYEVPEEKKEKWRSIQNMVHKEYEVCIEHCGYDNSCFDRCTETYRNRLDREYLRLTNE